MNLKVTTAHSLYFIDTEAQVFTRLPSALGSVLTGDNESQAYEWITPGSPGTPMQIGLANGKVRVTTPVTEVETIV